MSDQSSPSGVNLDRNQVQIFIEVLGTMFFSDFYTPLCCYFCESVEDDVLTYVANIPIPGRIDTSLCPRTVMFCFLLG